MGFERWILRTQRQNKVMLMVVIDKRISASEKLLANMLASLNLTDDQFLVCEVDDFESCMVRIIPKIILALGAAGIAVKKRNLSIPLVCSKDLLEILKKPLVKKTVQDDLALILAWLTN